MGKQAFARSGRGARSSSGAGGIGAAVETIVDSAAARLNVHPNTLRHRLKRYEEVSGLRPTRVEDTILMKEAKDE
jgi:hypothetical protein